MFMISEVNRKELIKNYNDTVKSNTMVRKLVKKLDVEPEIAMKYTSSLEDSANELKNCEERFKKLKEKSNTKSFIESSIISF